MPLWTPAQIATDWWIDAADVSTIYDASAGGSLVADGGNVGRIEDKSGNGRHATQSTSAQRATRSGPTITFASRWLQFPPTVMGPNRCFIGVWNSSSTGGSSDAGFIVLNTGPIDNPELNFGMATGGNNINFWWNSGYAIQSNQGAATRAIYASTFSNTVGSVTATIHKNGTQTATGTRSGTWSNFLATNCAIGYYPRINAYRNGTLCELIVCDPSNREIVEGYLAWKWGHVADLPSGHPYKAAPPGDKPTGIGGEVLWICPSLDDVGNGTALARDFASGNGGFLTNMDPPTDWVADTSNGGVRALDFDGVNDLIELGSMGGDLTENIPFSVSMWALARATGQNDGLISRDQGGPYAFAVRFNGGSAITLLTDNVTFTGPTIATNVWFHLAVILAPSLRRFYLNGLLTHETTAAYTVTTNSDVLRIGCDFNPAADRCWNGLIDDCRIFSRALTQTEITALASQRGYQLPSNTRRRRYTGGYGL